MILEDLLLTWSNLPPKEKNSVYQLKIQAFGSDLIQIRDSRSIKK
jgi:hypothetical protein